MFEVCTTMMTQLIQLLPGILALYVLFDLIGGLLFNK